MVRLRRLCYPLVLCAPTTIVAQEAPSRFELTPFAGYRIGGELATADASPPSEIADSRSAGLIFDVRQHADTQWEIYYGHEETRLESARAFAPARGLALDVDSLQFGGTYQFDAGNARPFVVMTVGMTRFAPVRSELGAESYFSASIGGGIQLRPDRPVGIRLDAHVHATLLNSSGGIFCASVNGAGVCAIHVEGSALYQWEARAGVVFRF
ncbi:MAG TPA: hypothetical protein VFV10_02785 [Gammaproteobacteria bacterium]|nr:hypothetical protein [Gammaproteobacteria bacterium]